MKQSILFERVLSDLSGARQALFGLLLICVLILWGTTKWKNRRVEQLAAMFPGPTALPIIGNAHEFLNSSPEDILSSLQRLGKTYESPFRFWLGGKLCILISKPEDLQIVLNNSKTLGKDDIYRFLEQVVGTGLVTAPVEKWKKTRKAIVPAFAPKSLALVQPVFNKKAAILAQQIRRHCSTGVETDLYPYFVCASLDAICDAAFGIQTNTQFGENSSFADTLNRGTVHVARRLYKPWLHPDFIFERTSYAKELDEGCRILRGFANHVVEERRRALKKPSIELGSDENNSNNPNNNNHEDVSATRLLDVIFKLNEGGGQFEFSDEDLTDEVLSFLIAASETSAVTSSFCLLLLAMHPEFQMKVFEEQYKIFGNTDRPAKVEDLSKMEYMEQVLKETLRVLPTFPLVLRSVEAETKLTQNFILPEGSTAVIAPLLTHSDPKLWPNPEEFNPDNFSAKNLEQKHKYSFIAFSGGPRGCIGYRYAMMILKTAVSTFIRNYDITTSTKKIEDIKLYSDIIIRCKGGWNVKLEPRIYPEL